MAEMSILNGYEIVDRKARAIAEAITRAGSGAGLWLLAGVTASEALATSVNATSLVGLESPGVDTIRVGDLVICKDGGLLYTEDIVTADGICYVTMTSGENGSENAAVLSIKGPKGDKGDTGATGPQGLQGDKGDKGETGATGPQGLQGEKGDKGDKGDTGATGPQGEKGEKGDTGETGQQGPQGEKGDKGDTGVQGEKGDTGETGATPKISIGTVSTLAAGANATATMTGTAENPVLNLGIPKGVPGDSNTETIGDAYDSTIAYDVGDYCINNNILYKCTQATEAGEEFNAAKWQVTNIAAELDAINEAVSYTVVIDDEAGTINFIDR